jgi:hypothetical protein
MSSFSDVPLGIVEPFFWQFQLLFLFSAWGAKNSVKAKKILTPIPGVFSSGESVYSGKWCILLGIVLH